MALTLASAFMVIGVSARYPNTENANKIKLITPGEHSQLADCLSRFR